jgi:hypothetical protein
MELHGVGAEYAAFAYMRGSGAMAETILNTSLKNHYHVDVHPEDHSRVPPAEGTAYTRLWISRLADTTVPLERGLPVAYARRGARACRQVVRGAPEGPCRIPAVPRPCGRARQVPAWNEGERGPWIGHGWDDRRRRGRCPELEAGRPCLRQLCCVRAYSTPRSLLPLINRFSDHMYVHSRPSQNIAEL